jgi:hypothetical protein
MTDTSPERRRFLSIFTTALLALIGGIIATPVVAFVTSPLRRRGGAGPAADFSDAGALDSIAQGNWTLVPIEIVRQNGWAKSRESRSVWVRRDGMTAKDVKVL